MVDFNGSGFKLNVYWKKRKIVEVGGKPRWGGNPQ